MWKKWLFRFFSILFSNCTTHSISLSCKFNVSVEKTWKTCLHWEKKHKQNEHFAEKLIYNIFNTNSSCYIYRKLVSILRKIRFEYVRWIVRCWNEFDWCNALAISVSFTTVLLFIERCVWWLPNGVRYTKQLSCVYSMNYVFWFDGLDMCTCEIII